MDIIRRIGKWLNPSIDADDICPDVHCRGENCPVYDAALHVVNPITSWFEKERFPQQLAKLEEWTDSLEDEHMKFHMHGWLKFARREHARHLREDRQARRRDEVLKRFNPPR